MMTGSNLARWEYHTWNGTLEMLRRDRLAALGAEGWEAVGITDYGGGYCIVLLKRPIVDE